MEPRVKCYLFEDRTRGHFGDGKWRLLRAVKEHGSLRKAARSLGRGYRKAWSDIRETEESFGRALVVRSRGGAEGGATKLTEFGEELLERWEVFRSRVAAEMREAYDECLGEIMKGEDIG